MTIAVLNEVFTTPVHIHDGTNNIDTTAWTATAGSVILVFITRQDDATTITVSDTVNGSTYGSALETVTSAGNRSLFLYAKTNSAGGSNTVHVAFSGFTNQCGVWAIEIGGAMTSGAVDTHNNRKQSTPGTGTDAITTNSATNSAQPALVLGFSSTYQGGGGFAPVTGTGFTAGGADFDEDFGTNARSENKRVTATGSQTGTFTAAGGGGDLFEYLSIIVNVLEATGGAAANTANILNIRA